LNRFDYDMNRFSRPVFAFLAATIGALAMVALFYLTSRGQETGPDIKVEATPVNRDAKLGVSFAPVIKRAAPCVVYIYSTRIVPVRPYRNPLLSDPFVRQFFGDQLPPDSQPRTRRQQSLGSGVMVSPDGYILTANHVVDGADEIKVKVASVNGDKEYSARVIGTDPPTDVAVLKIDAVNLPANTLGDSDQVDVGDVVLAIGDPFGLERTVTMGIVSALGRSGFQFGGEGAGRQPNYQDFIQTDAAINPGNSGGALVDVEGRLLGINTGIIPNDNGGNQGIGFAVPVNLARHVMERLIHGGKVARGYLGIWPEDINPGLAESFGLSDQSGALVGDVRPGTAAQKAGLESGDVIVEFDGKKVADVAGLMLMVSECSPGTETAVKVIRDGHEKSFTVKLDELPGQVRPKENNQNNGLDNSSPDTLNGVTVSDLDQPARQQLVIPDSVHGALVTDVGQDSNSAEAGLQPGDVIVEINRQPVNNAREAIKLCTQAKGNRILLKVLRRNGDFAGTTYLSVDNTKAP
jgi:serine protease Do